MSDEWLTAAQRRYREYLRSPHWRQVRARILDRAREHCERCGYFCGPVEVLESVEIDYRIADLMAGEVEPCEVCGRYCQFRSDDDNSGRVWLEVHHRSYERVGRERDDDLIALCFYCHDETTEREQYRALVRRIRRGDRRSVCVSAQQARPREPVGGIGSGPINSSGTTVINRLSAA